MSANKLTVIPRLSFAFVNASNDEIVNNNKNSACVAGSYVSQNWEHKQDCAKFELSLDSGCDADPSSLFNTPYDFQQYIYSYVDPVAPSSLSNSVKLQKCLLTLSLQNIENISCNLSFGFQQDVATDSNGGFKGGWINYDPRKYYGYGWGIYQPFHF